MATLHKLSARRHEPTQALQQVGDQDFVTWLREVYEAEVAAVLRDPDWLAEEVGNWLQDIAGISVREDGYIEVWTLPDHISSLLRELPIVLYHHTATGKGGRLERRIRREGLVRQDRGERADELSSGSGVYLTSSTSGPAVAGYQHKARRKHGGDRLILEVVVTVDELSPDPDDGDITSGATQWITSYVPPNRILP